MTLETTVINSDIRRSWGGLAAGLVVALVGMACGTWLISNGHDWAGSAIVTADLVGLVSVFVYGQHSRRAERRERLETTTGKRRK